VHVKGEVETREEVPTTPVAVLQAGGAPSNETLPVTGFNAAIQVMLGGLFLVGGTLLFRRSRLT
jgi:LPXTG-motif cell wall-anchored protein